MPSKPPPIFEFLLFDGFSNMVLASAMEPLRDVRMNSGQEIAGWRVSTLDGAPVTSSSGLQITPDGAFDDGGDNRTLVLVAGYHVRGQVTPALLARLRGAVRRAELVLALDTAAWLLAAAGVLDGHTATIHWQELEAFAETFPKVEVSTARFVRSGAFLTCGGASTALDMMLSLIQDLYGSAAAFGASTMFVYDPSRQSELNRGAARLEQKGSPKILKAANLMAETIETPMSTAALAKRVSLSERTLARAFQRELGMTPGKYYKMLRLQHARYLSEETHLSLEQIALRCGFSSASSLGRSFSGHYGRTIREARGQEKPWDRAAQGKGGRS
ncbi:GlxA family transcriptional regulator [Leisingera sp. McT4-56]|uniref:GlxA family transcriptional regulator n=1 Tax=Leisingera sp. McT4-56 TaxID=2881255 RepID=UPI001CF813B4|nr:GlxA family transcriptional regulator [Leisingera sp. McT4-56]MCB4457057.1 GlxA family transcriptional regulator [Leisingera sp. McT4-56]